MLLIFKSFKKLDKMNAKNLIIVMFLLLVGSTVFSQEKTKKQLKEERKIEKQKQTAILVDSKDFVFIADKALPQGYKTIDLTTNPNYVKFQPDFIKSEMPFFGRAYSGSGYGGDGGLDFEGKPEEFTIEKGKNSYKVKAVVKGDNDTYTLLLSVFFEGSASLTINSSKRSTISYNGEISAPVKEGNK
ncbi:hypothetical protein D3C84_195140 [compost metagenome]